MDFAGFAGFILLAALVTLISYGFDRLYARIVPVRLLYYAIRMPGIVLHELAHIVGCLVTGAEIKKVVLFSKEGGSVTYADPKIPLLGTVIISTLPLIILPLILSLLTWVFSYYFGCSLAIAPPSGDAGSATSQMISTVIALYATNLFVRFNGWFLLYLYFVTSIILSLAPSRQDFANAAAGIAIIAISCVLVIRSGYAPAISLLDIVIAPMAYAFSLGLIFEMIVAVISLPLIFIYGLKKEG